MFELHSGLLHSTVVRTLNLIARAATTIHVFLRIICMFLNSLHWQEVALTHRVMGYR